MVGIAVACGLAGALGAVVLRILVRLVQAIAFEGSLDSFFAEGWLAEPTDPLAVASALEWYWRFLIPIGGALLVGPICYFLAREAKGHGVPEVMKAIAVRGGAIRPRVAAAKAVASALTIGTGGSAGREGPIIQIGSAIGSGLGQWLNLPAHQVRTMVGCGAAAGMAATFNAPIAGALFVAEVIMGGYAVVQFGPIVIASVVATVVSRFFLGNHPAFVVPAYEIVSPFEIAPYMLVGVVAGLVAITFIRTLHATEIAFERLRMPDYLKAAVGAAGVGLIGIWLPQIFGVGYSSISGALYSQLPALTLGLLLIAKIAATSLTLGSGGSGGIFAPSLFLGAVAGGFCGSFIHQWFPDLTAASGAYALVTMGAVVAATTHAPISAMLIIFELTQSIDIIPALMCACVISTLVCQLLSKDSIYTIKLRHQGHDFFEGLDPNPLKQLYVRDVVDRGPEIVSANASFQQLLDLVVQSTHSQFFVVDAQERLLGTISLTEVRRLIFERDTLQHVLVAGDLVEVLPATVKLGDDLDIVLHLFSSAKVDEIAVVDDDDPHMLIGVVRESGVIEARNQAMLQRDLVGGLSSGVSAVGRGQAIELGGDYILQQIAAPPHLFDLSLAQTRLRESLGVQVLLIRSHTSDGSAPAAVRVPAATDVIREGDELVVAGSREGIAGVDRKPAE